MIKIGNFINNKRLPYKIKMSICEKVDAPVNSEVHGDSLKVYEELLLHTGAISARDKLATDIDQLIRDAPDQKALYKLTELTLDIFNAVYGGPRWVQDFFPSDPNHYTQTLVWALRDLSKRIDPTHNIEDYERIRKKFETLIPRYREPSPSQFLCD